jgi:hypothetical protein
MSLSHVTILCTAVRVAGSYSPALDGISAFFSGDSANPDPSETPHECPDRNGKLQATLGIDK